MSTVYSPSALPTPPLDRPRGRRALRLWLAVVALMVIATILVGGVTRLTDSGLSITEWQPFAGVVPPLDEADWQAEFDKYKTTTEFQTVNASMSLDAFKRIYWWEWGHRMLGRAIGVVVVVPLAGFWLAGWLTARLKWQLLALLALGALQGAIGWWMVASGLVGRTDVSQYRLAIHLTLAVLILAFTVWLFAGLSRRLRLGSTAPAARPLAALALALVVVQVFMGGLVAGLDAGLAYNTWPLMDGRLVPEGLSALRPNWINLFDNAATVQFQHRLTAYVLALVAAVIAVLALRSERDPASRASALALFALVAAQLVLGVVTLLASVPFALALAHQGLAVAVAIAAVVHLRRVTPAADQP